MRKKQNGFNMNPISWFRQRTEDDPEDEDEVQRHVDNNIMTKADLHSTDPYCRSYSVRLVVHWAFPRYSHVLRDSRHAIPHERWGGYPRTSPRLHLLIHRCPIVRNYRHQSCLHCCEGIFIIITVDTGC